MRCARLVLCTEETKKQAKVLLWVYHGYVSSVLQYGISIGSNSLDLKDFKSEKSVYEKYVLSTFGIYAFGILIRCVC